MSAPNGLIFVPTLKVTLGPLELHVDCNLGVIHGLLDRLLPSDNGLDLRIQCVAYKGSLSAQVGRYKLKILGAVRALREGLIARQPALNGLLLERFLFIQGKYATVL